MSTPHTIVLFGAAGRMGRRIAALAPSHHTRVLAAVVRPRSPLVAAPVPDTAPPITYSTLDTLDTGGEIVHAAIDFSSPDALFLTLKTAVSRRWPLLVGTTGLTPQHHHALADAARHIPVLHATNTSLGVAALTHTAAALAAILGPDYHASIVESHHIHKKDAPSGTAKSIASALRAANAQLHDQHILSIRAGDIIGEHTIRFAGPGETIELTHRATSRDLFAHGALRAARWLATQPPGLHTISDSLGIAAR
jgi:4-hydroxy-tetrahydrodipicolinate reductase